MARKDIVDRIGRLARAVANADRKGDDPAVEKWSIRLAAASSSLAVLVNPDLAEPDPTPVPVDPASPPPAPDLTSPYRMSSGIFNAWATAFLMRAFPEAYGSGATRVLTQEAIAEAASKAGVLAEMTASGVLGVPDGPSGAIGDWRYFTAYNSDGYVSKVWILGKLVAEVATPDGWALAVANGIDPVTW